MDDKSGHFWVLRSLNKRGFDFHVMKWSRYIAGISTCYIHSMELNSHHLLDFFRRFTLWPIEKNDSTKISQLNDIVAETTCCSRAPPVYKRSFSTGWVLIWFYHDRSWFLSWWCNPDYKTCINRMLQKIIEPWISIESKSQVFNMMNIGNRTFCIYSY